MVDVTHVLLAANAVILSSLVPLCRD